MISELARPWEEPLLAVLVLYWKMSCSRCNFSCDLMFSVALMRRGAASSLLLVAEVWSERLDSNSVILVSVHEMHLAKEEPTRECVRDSNILFLIFCSSAR